MVSHNIPLEIPNMLYFDAKKASCIEILSLKMQDSMCAVTSRSVCTCEIACYVFLCLRALTICKHYVHRACTIPKQKAI